MADISKDDLVQAAVDLVISRLDEKYELVHVDYRDSLSDEQIQHLFAEETDWDKVLDPDWEAENRSQGVKAVLENLLDDDARDFLDEHGDAAEQVRYAIEERDESDPVGDLMRNTDNKLFRYRLDGEADGFPWGRSEEQNEKAARSLAASAGVDFTQNVKAFRELVWNASYGSGLYVLWRGPIEPVYEAVCKVRHHDPAPEFPVQWTDPELLVLDRLNGSGYAVPVKGTVRVTFDPDRLHLDAQRLKGGYSWSDVVCDSHYHPNGGEPEFIYPKEEPSDTAA